MSQMNEVTIRNLYEYGDYFKKSLVIGLIVAICTPLALIGIFAPGLFLFIGFVLLAGAIAVLVFQIMMLIRLSRAKDASPQPFLVKSFQYFIIGILVSIVGIIFGFIPLVGYYVEWGCSILSVVFNLLAWQSLANYIALYGSEVGPSEGFQMISTGVKSYIMYGIINLGISFVDFILGFIFWNDPYTWDTADTIGIIISLISLVVAILTIVAQFKVANGMIMIFTSTRTVPSGAPSASPKMDQMFANAAQSSTTETERYCSKCGVKMMPGAKFCTNCGATFE